MRFGITTGLYLLFLSAVPLLWKLLRLASRSHVSLSSLNDDVLLEICAAVKQSSTTAEREARSYANKRSSLSWRWHDINNCNRSPLSLFATSTHSLGPLNALSSTDRHLRQLAAPDIFRSIKIGDDWAWNKALRALESVASCKAVGQYTKNFRVDLYVGSTWMESAQGRIHRKGPKPPNRFPSMLLHTLSQLKRLQELALIIPEFHTEIFRKTFEESNVSFPSVRTLVLGPHMDWVIAMCPNIESIATHDWRWIHSNVDGDYTQRHSWELIVSAGRAKTLRHFEMMEWWTLERLEAVYRNMPEIQSLAMLGGRYHEGIKTLLPVLGRFSHLTSLSLADVGSLGVDYTAPGCGNPYLGPRGRKLWRQDQRKARVASRRAARMVYTELPGLKELWIGGHKENKIKS